MTETGSRSGYDSTAEKAQGQTKKVTGKLSDDMEKAEEGAVQETLAQEQKIRPSSPGSASRRLRRWRTIPAGRSGLTSTASGSSA